MKGLWLRLSSFAGCMTMAAGGCYVTPHDSAYSGSSYGSPCEVGQEGCSCTSQGQCTTGLECVIAENTCVASASCAVGARGCACTDGGACDAGNLCKENVCVSDEPCLPELIGAEGCQCTLGGGCDPGLACLSDLCVEASTTSTSTTWSEESGTVTTIAPDESSGGRTSGVSETDVGSSSGGITGASTGAEVESTGAGETDPPAGETETDESGGEPDPTDSDDTTGAAGAESSGETG